MMSSESTIGPFKMVDPKNSSMLGLHHIEFNHPPIFLFSFVGYTFLFYTTLRLYATYVFWLQKGLERSQERAYKKENECDNVTKARKKKNSIINSDTDSGKTA